MAERHGAVEEMVAIGGQHDAAFWRGKRVLLTGHTGFKGAWLALWLQKLGADVTGVSLPPEGETNLFDLARIEELADSRFLDIGEAGKFAALVRAVQPELVFHLAAQAIVRTSYADPLTTFSTNMMGTANVLDALRGVQAVRVVVAITTDKVYQNLGHPYPYRELDALGGHDPYSASKAASEMVIASYRDSYLRSQGVAVASARAGNVIGGGDWASDRLLPDAIRAWQAGQTLVVRRPGAVRPWQHVLEPLSAYLTLAERLWDQPELAGAYNFGPDGAGALTVRQVIERAQLAFGSGDVQFEANADGPHEAQLLSLETAKARSVLGIRPVWSSLEGVDRTVAWYLGQGRGTPARELCEHDLKAFENG